ncbi:hydrogenase nickel incorporation protein HypA/HybF [Frankia sp. EI5c]|uniref:hydrogenase/urease maturation nickel metallochaperone HypA n=1 Tax=Frankia sp. EI5c TaxID=683316 RepID=UPI0007C340F5|nr:hydrogenase/urease maturation nickel metallochaperone HypA [Frankia sp. EI5c]OAA19796.1 hydrogenase nickel incorporation protein HypA/HybF [Frankia sp. EI5c]
MHEAGLARAAVTTIIEASAGAPVRTVVLAAADGVDIASAAAAWRAAAAGTCLETTDVAWQRVLDRLRCFSCGHEYDGTRLDPCTACGGNGLVVAPADELAVVSWTT